MSDAVEVYFAIEDGVTVDAVTDVLAYCEEKDPTGGDVGEGNYEEVAEGLVRDEDRQRFRYALFDYALAGQPGVAGIYDAPLLVSVDEVYFRSHKNDYGKQDILSAAEELYDLVGGIYEHLVDCGHRVRWVVGLGPGEVMTASQTGTQFSVDRFKEKALEEFYWLQILPPEVVDDIGRDTVLSMPAWRVRELSNGAVQFGLGLVPTYDVAAFPDRTVVYDQEEIREHLGLRD